MPGTLTLNLVVTDAESVAYIGKLPHHQQTEKALLALRIGVQALNNASGAIDVDAVRAEGAQLIFAMKSALDAHASAVSQGVGTALGKYLDPRTGAFQQRVDRLVSVDLDALLKAHVGDAGTVARTIAQGVGAESQFFKMVDPARKDGLIGKLSEAVNAALADQRASLLAEFSLDRPDSALSHLVREVKQNSAEVVMQLSLDVEDSALSRLVGRMEQSQKLITEQFSLDSEDSALSAMLRGILRKVEEMRLEQRAFQDRTLELITRMKEREDADASGTRHGFAFEESLLHRLILLTEAAGDVFDATGTTTGLIRGCKKGDGLVTIGPERAGAGRKVVWEAKEDRGYGDTQILAECEEARKNRGAELCVFVLSAKVAGGARPFRRIGDTFIIVWSAEDERTNVVLEAAHAASTAILAKNAAEQEGEEFDCTVLEREIAEVEKQAAKMSDVRTKCDSIRSATSAIEEIARIAGEKIQTSAQRLRGQVALLR